MRSVNSKNDIRVIVVEDDDDLRQLMVEDLKGEGLRTQEADSVTGAFTRLSNHVFDVAVLDLKLGANTSAELIRWIRTHKKETINKLPIILISGFLDNNVLKVLGRSVDFAFTKPFESKILIQKIKELV